MMHYICNNHNMRFCNLLYNQYIDQCIVHNSCLNILQNTHFHSYHRNCLYMNWHKCQNNDLCSQYSYPCMNLYKFPYNYQNSDLNMQYCMHHHIVCYKIIAFQKLSQ